MTRTDELTILNPADIALFHHAGVLRLTLHDRSYLSARIYRAFPISDPSHYYGITDGAGKDIGMIVDPSQMDEAGQKAAAFELELRYFVPVVRKVLGITDDYGATAFEVETDRGNRRYLVRSLRDNTVELPGGRLIITDVDGNRFEIGDIHSLDPRSQEALLKSM
jgi:hypothetical protein